MIHRCDKKSVQSESSNRLAIPLTIVTTYIIMLFFVTHCMQGTVIIGLVIIIWYASHRLTATQCDLSSVTER